MTNAIIAVSGWQHTLGSVTNHLAARWRKRTASGQALAMRTPIGVLGDAGGDLQKLDRREIGLGEGMNLGEGVADGEDQPIGGGVKDNRIGLRSWPGSRCGRRRAGPCAP